MDENRIELRRALECSAALLLALATVPVVIATAITSLIVYRAWPFFSHHRVGRHGRPFRLVKVRTLPPTTSRYSDKYSLDQRTALPDGAHPACPPRRAAAAVARRVRPDGARRASTGDGSTVAAMPDHVAAERQQIRPGLTGLWQMSPHCAGLISEHASTTCSTCGTGRCDSTPGSCSPPSGRCSGGAPCTCTTSRTPWSSDVPGPSWMPNRDSPRRDRTTRQPGWATTARLQRSGTGAERGVVEHGGDEHTVRPPECRRGGDDGAPE